MFSTPLNAYTTAVNDRLEAAFQAASRRWDDSPAYAEFIAPIRDLCRGGKRMRARLAALGWSLFAESENSPASDPDFQRPDLISLGAAIELFQAAALVHDDIIDQAQTRRSHPCAHLRYAATLDAHGGVSAAILAGDFLLGLADLVLAEAALPPAVNRHWSVMTTQVAVGQFFDLRASHYPDHDSERSLRILREKSAYYSVVHPLLLGALLAGASPTQIDALEAIALPWGEAFQLRDDVLGVFGSDAVTGKSQASDIQEGKRTVLLALTAAAAPHHPALEIVGREFTSSQYRALTDLIEESGARAEHEQLITSRYELGIQRLIALDADEATKQYLIKVADKLAHRDH